MAFMKGLKSFSKRNLNLKSLLKVGTFASGMIPGVGGAVQSTLGNISNAVQLKKDKRNAEAQAQIELASSTAGETAGTLAGKFLSQTASKAYASASNEVKEGVGLTGSQMMDSSIKEWLKSHWKLLAGIIGGLFTLFFVLPKIMGSHRPSPRRRY